MCQAILRGVEGAEWEMLYRKFQEKNTEINVRNPGGSTERGCSDDVRSHCLHRNLDPQELWVQTACRIHFGADGSVGEGGREGGDGRRKQDLNSGRFESFVAVL